MLFIQRHGGAKKMCYAIDMNIRQASLQDASLLSALCADVQTLHASHHPGLFKIPASPDFAEPFFREQLQDPFNYFFIAEQAGLAIGYIFCKLIERPANAFRHADRFLHIDQISVTPARQKLGAGAALIARARTLARELDLKRIQLDTWEFNHSAHAFFEREGFVKFNYRYWLNLD
jgi:ribosomal protein S18 acetylase RimI-like enzyme